MSGNPTGPVPVATGSRHTTYGTTPTAAAVGRSTATEAVARRSKYYFNDTGRQVDLFRESLKAHLRHRTTEDGYQGAYVAEVAAKLGLGPETP